MTRASGGVGGLDAARDVLVRAVGLRKSYRIRGRRDPVLAVDDVSFDLHRGESVALVGESGSGKTTVAGILVGLVRPEAGTVEIDGVAPGVGNRTARDRRSRSRRVQIVFQDPYSSLDPRQTIEGAIDEMLVLHTRLDAEERGRRIAELLGDVGLAADLGAQLPRALSGGQLQRAAIARALAAEPGILVLDEAVSALDVTVQAQVLRLLARLREEQGLTYLFITHDLAVANEISDRVLVMRSGRIVEQGDTASVLTAPQHPYTRLLLASLPRPGWDPAAALRLRDAVESDEAEATATG